VLQEIATLSGSKPVYDHVRNTINITQPPDAELVGVLRKLLNWLDANAISFSRLATSEANLEEVFLAIAREEESNSQ